MRASQSPTYLERREGGQETTSIEHQSCASHYSLEHKGIKLLGKIWLSWISSRLFRKLSGKLRMRVMDWITKKDQKNSVKCRRDYMGSYLMSWFPPLCRMDEGDAVIRHPGMVCVMVKLLPRLYHEDHPQVPTDEHKYLSLSHDWSFILLLAWNSFSSFYLRCQYPWLSEPSLGGTSYREVLVFWILDWFMLTLPRPFKTACIF